MLAIFASPSLRIKLNGYDFDNIVSTKVYSLDNSTNRDNKIRVSETIDQCSLIYAEVKPELKLKFCMYEASYTVSALKNSNVYDEVVFLTEKLRLLKPIYHLKREFVGNFGRSVTEEFLRQANETTYFEEHNQSFMAKNQREGAMHAEPAEWISTTRQKIIENVVKSNNYIGIIWRKLVQRNLLNYKDPLSFTKSVFIKTTYLKTT